jgi:hypothetical protein
MIIGTMLMKMNGLACYSPTFGRGGNAAVFTCEVLDISGSSPTLDIDVEHKNVEDTAWTSLVAFSQITSVGLKTAEDTGVKEQLRFKYPVGGTPATNAVYFNMLAPVWRPY